MSPSIIIIFGCLGMFILAFGIVLFVIAYQKKVLASQNEMQLAENKFQNQLIEATLLTEQEEREKIAKNLHDDLGTSLNIIRLNLQKLNRNTGNEEIVKTVSQTSLDMIASAMQDVRSISRDLMPATLMKLGFVQSMKELVKHINESGQITFEFNTIPFDKKIEEKTEVQLYRICQEVLNNILKHGKPTAIFMELSFKDSISVVFKHNGIGISDDEIRKIYALNKGVGLKSIESRIRMINGKITYIQKSTHESAIEITAKV